MAKTTSLLPLSLCFLVFFTGCLARQQWQQTQNQCQLDRIQALEPNNRVECEAGRIESWDPSHDQFQCAGVAVVRRKIEPNGLLLPHFSNSPQLIYIIKGRGINGAVISGCPETFQDSRGSSQQGQGRRRFQDQHQKIHHFREGDVLFIPAGIPYWAYNNGNEEVVSVSLIDVSNNANQLDLRPRKFHLAGNPEHDFEPQEEQRRRGEQGHSRGQQGSGQRSSCNNVFCGFDSRILAEAFNVDQKLIERIQNDNDDRGQIVKVKGGELQVVRPPSLQDERYEQEESPRRYGRGNGIEETLCSWRLKENIGDPSRADIYSPETGRISTVNSFNLPILRQYQLSAEYGVLKNNALMVPYYNLNAHSIVYAIRGRARIQIVDNYGQTVFDGELQQGQVLTVPQNFAIVKRAESERFEWVSFKTNDNAMISTLAGKTSAIRGIPADVLANAFQISREEASRLKFNRKESTVAQGSGSPGAGRRADA
ncbi:legumin family protein [Tripterygium wilfordii]|uniref:Legumin family protein n=1 Tax=Tripterygium wilfordii TaxID=458696 RepID=A0A7J7D6G0_TRIWF|nr:11S globulin seed storage protein 1-like [Tripterygium wilfordii]KAF5741849.1 legumin family protein [Tripterygium wilfordii]